VAGSNLFTGTLDLLILKATARGAVHGYAIGLWIRQTSSGILQVEEGALYPALHRLEKQGWLESDWGLTDSGREAKFYSLTGAGRRQLRTERGRWTRHVGAVEAVLQAKS
jgi:transcriptional regulator